MPEGEDPGVDPADGLDAAFAAASDAPRQPEVQRKDALDDLAVVDLEQDIGLKKIYATRLMRLMTAQVVTTNVVFVVYAWAGPGWDVPPEVMIAWLGSTVVELIAITAIVTRYLFPSRDAGPG